MFLKDTPCFWTGLIIRDQVIKCFVWREWKITSYTVETTEELRYWLAIQRADQVWEKKNPKMRRAAEEDAMDHSYLMVWWQGMEGAQQRFYPFRLVLGSQELMLSLSGHD